MNKELREAIYQKGSMINALGGGFWYMEAPQKAAHPYAVFSFVSNPMSRDTATKFEDYYLQINIYDKDGANIEVLKERITEAFDDSEKDFSLDSWHFERIERQFVTERKIEDVFMVTIQYKIELTKK